MSNILITRLREHSQEIETLFQKRKFNTFTEPLFSVKQIQITEKCLSKPSAIIITSANACQAVIDFAPPKTTRIFAVGKSTAKKLLKVGFKNIVFPPKISAESLKEIIQKTHQNKSSEILYFHGSSIALDFQKELAESGFKVRSILSYEVVPMEDFSSEFLQISAQQKFDFVLIFSKNSARSFCNLARKHNLLEYFSTSQILCLSDKILADVQKFGLTNSKTFKEFPILNKFYDRSF